MTTLPELIRHYVSLLHVGQRMESVLTYLALVFLVALVCVSAHLVTKRLLLRGLHAVVRTTKMQWDDLLLEKRVFERLAHIAPALVLYGAAGAVFSDLPTTLLVAQRFAVAYMIFVGILVVDACLNVTSEILSKVDAARDKPVKAYVQVVKLLLYLVGAILVISTLVDRSPWALLSGLGAMTAILMLVFKDSILGFVSSVQLSAYDLVRVGDWIEFPAYGADGDVVDISLNVIQIQNWDKTISTVPTAAFMSGSFKNWRGMSRSGGRRIKRAIRIDMSTVRFCDKEMLERFKKIKYISQYIDEKIKEVSSYNEEHSVDETSLVNGRRLTNLGTFRAYVQAYVKNHPKIKKDMTLLVRQLAPTETGIPIEIYCFSSDQAWVNYEGIMGDMFDHLLAVIPEFDLAVFQAPSGRDVAKLRAA